MRIATWNLERGGRTRAAAALQEQTLREIAADIAVLTEPPDSYKAGADVVLSATLPYGPSGQRPWVAIVGSNLEPLTVDAPYANLSVAARATVEGRSVVVYGAVLPWLSVRSHEPKLHPDAASFDEVFTRVLDAQRAEILSLRSKADLLVWAGDFNQSLEGPVRGCSEKGRTALTNCLADLGFVACNAGATHAMPELRAIDLLCGPKDQQIVAQGRIDPVRNGATMSDHAGYWVDI